MKKIFYSILFASFICTGCSKNKESVISAKFPVTKECAQQTLRKYKEVIKVETVNVTYKEFDFKLISHPEIEGYIQIDSKVHKSIKDLEGLFNTALFHCHATSTTELKKDEISDSVKLIDPEYAYIKVHKNNAKMIYKKD